MAVEAVDEAWRDARKCRARCSDEEVGLLAVGKCCERFYPGGGGAECMARLGGGLSVGRGSMWEHECNPRENHRHPRNPCGYWALRTRQTHSHALSHGDSTGTRS
jgi:hypothetical protein